MIYALIAIYLFVGFMYAVYLRSQSGPIPVSWWLFGILFGTIILIVNSICKLLEMEF